MSDTTAPLHFKQGYKYGAHDGPEPPQHCGHCGRPMVVTTERDPWQPIDRETGAVRYDRHARCSRPWWAAIVGIHEHAIEDADHQWAWLA